MTDAKNPDAPEPEKTSSDQKPEVTPVDNKPAASGKDKPEEFGGPKGLEPTRYGDWERKGILSDF